MVGDEVGRVNGNTSPFGEEVEARDDALWRARSPSVCVDERSPEGKPLIPDIESVVTGAPPSGLDESWSIVDRSSVIEEETAPSVRPFSSRLW